MCSAFYVVMLESSINFVIHIDHDLASELIVVLTRVICRWEFFSLIIVSAYCSAR